MFVLIRWRDVMMSVRVKACNDEKMKEGDDVMMKEAE